jgi:lysylphosphatidylglycerol synthetase-like protein (DUF2156 family)/UDP-2,3-diacylglucosamine pyrophosphatase LpxH
VPDLITVTVPPGGGVVVASDLHLGPVATDASLAAADELARRIDDWRGPGAVVLAGDIFELWASPVDSPIPALDAHAQLAAVLEEFARAKGHRLIIVPGNHDGRLAWDEAAVEALRHRLRAEVALAVDIEIQPSDRKGEVQRVRVEHGNQLDPHNAFVDARSPLDRPFGFHVSRLIVPVVERTGASEDSPGWMDGLHELDDPGDAAAMVGSRLVYRQLVRRLRWLAVPFLLIIALRLPLILAAVTHQRWLGTRAGQSAELSVAIGLGLVVNLALVVMGIALVARRSFKSLASLDVGERGIALNGAPRARAAHLVASGYAGYVSGHTHQPELAGVPGGFYANCGSGGRMVSRRQARLGLPPVYLRARHISYLVLENEPTGLVVRLVYRRAPERDGTWLERLLAVPDPSSVSQLAVVATYPDGGSWPMPPAEAGSPSRRPRRLAAVALGLLGLLNLVSALTPPLRDRLDGLGEAVPQSIPAAAGALAALSGVGLLLVALGVRRGQRRAWVAAVTLLALSVVLNVVKGLDIEEAAVSVGVACYLLANRQHFRNVADCSEWLRGLAPVAGAASLVVAAAGALAELTGAHQSVPKVLVAASERLVGLQNVPLGGRLGNILSVVLLPIGVALVGLAGSVLVRPPSAPRRRSRQDHPGSQGGEVSRDLERARSVVGRHGADTLAYFALRDDKHFFFWGDSVVAFAVHHGVCLVSPDPIGPACDRVAVWRAFRAYADRHGWSVAVVGAAAGWLPVYRRDGLVDRYIGDEAVVDVRRFCLEGKRNKALRQAVNRVARNGYHIEFHDPSELDEQLAAQLRELMTHSRRGDVERGFSMTLSRLFEPTDKGLLLAVAFDGDGRPAAFCQYVPAPAINGWSLDLMRRASGPQPNGLTDFVLVETIRHLHGTGATGLGLNFATMRAVLAGETGNRLERRVLEQLSESMQIESLWRFNAKFNPDWHPRYLVVDGAERFAMAGAAVATAESLWELPVLGRFLRTRRSTGSDTCPTATSAERSPTGCNGEPVPAGSDEPVIVSEAGTASGSARRLPGPLLHGRRWRRVGA